jgi:hypothetical protein
MMPHHLNMVRSQCRVAASFGGGVAAALATIRLSPQAGRESDLKDMLSETLHAWVDKPGLTGAHLLVTDTPTTSSPTTEQQIRGSDSAADWIVLLAGYDGEAVQRAAAEGFSSLHGAGAREKTTVGRYNLAFTMTPLDLAAT